MEFIKVSKDNWNFEGADSGKRFIPFGANFIFRCAREDGALKYTNSHTILTADEWYPEDIKKAFHAAKDLNMNLMKVFVPTPGILADPQPDDHAVFRNMTPSFPDRLRFLFQCAHETGVYISLTLAEWGVHSLKWFHDGGEFVGKRQSDTGVDSYKIYESFWKQIAKLCKDEPALFSYNLAVELYIPSSNWGGEHEDKYLCAFSNRWALDAFRLWLKNKYLTIAALNEAWNSKYADFDEIPQPNMKWLPSKKQYVCPRMAVADYNDFKECTVYFFLKNQADAIRSVDSRHMVTAGLHPDQTGIAPMGYGWKTCGINHNELDMLDYITTHLYTQIDYLVYRPLLPTNFEDLIIPFMATEKDLERRRRECLLYARFINCTKPVVAEEFGHLTRDYDECLINTKKLLEDLVGHVSGFQLWTYGSDEENNDWAPMGSDYKVSKWGKKWRQLNEKNGIVYNLPKERTQAKTIIKLDRTFGSIADDETAIEKIMRAWDAYEHPVDFIWPKNEILAQLKASGVKKVW